MRKEAINHKRYLKTFQYRPNRNPYKIYYYNMMNWWDSFVTESRYFIKNSVVSEKHLEEMANHRKELSSLSLGSILFQIDFPEDWNSEIFIKNIDLLMNKHFDILLEYRTDIDMETSDIDSIKLALKRINNTLWYLEKPAYRGKLKPLRRYLKTSFKRFKERIEIDNITIPEKETGTKNNAIKLPLIPEFKDFLTNDGKKMVSIIKNNFTNSKGQDLAFMLYALHGLGYIETQPHQLNKTKLHASLETLLGDIGTRQGLSNEIKKINEANNLFYKPQIDTIKSLFRSI